MLYILEGGGFTQLHHAHLSQGMGHELIVGQPHTDHASAPSFPFCSLLWGPPTSWETAPWGLGQCSQKA